MKKLGVMLLAAAFSLPVFAAKQAAQQPTATEQSKPPAKAKTHKAHSKKHSKKKASTTSTTTSTGTAAPAKK